VGSLSIPENKQVSAAQTWDLLVRTSGVFLIILLAFTYFTGDEFHHTYQISGYGLAAVIIGNAYWELIRPHLRRQHQPGSGVLLRAARLPSSFPSFIVVVVGSLMVLATATLVLGAVVHALSPTVDIDEIHEFIAYYVLGLVIVHVVGVVIASAGYLEDRASAFFKKQH